MSNIRSSANPTAQSEHPFLSDQNMHLQDFLSRALDYITGSGKDQMPRYGGLTLLARKIPGYVYDHPGLSQQQRTAFSTSHGIFFNADFLKKLAEEDVAAKRAGEKADSTIPLVLHELKHIYYRHHDRFAELVRRERDLVGIGTDIRINQDIEQLQTNFKRKLGKVFYEVGVGLSDEEKNLFSGASEDRIIQTLIGMRDKRQEDQKKMQSGASEDAPSNGGGQAGSGSSDPTQSNPSNAGDPDPDAPEGEGKADDNEPGQSGKDNQVGAENKDDPKDLDKKDSRTRLEKTLDSVINQQQRQMGEEEHVKVDARQLAKMMEDLGLHKEKAKLGLPDSGLQESASAKEKKNADQAWSHEGKKTSARLTEISSQMAQLNQRAKQRGSAPPGKHIDDYAEEILNGTFTPKTRIMTEELKSFTYKVSAFARDTQHTDDEPDDAYFLDPGDMGLDSELYLGSQISATAEGVMLNVVDSSASVNEDMLTGFYAEILGQVAEPDSGITNSFILNADTTRRGEVIEVTEDNIEEVAKKIKVWGRGGTNLERGMQDALKWAKDNNKKVHGLIVFSDLEDSVPLRENLPDDLPPTAFVTNPAHGNIALSIDAFRDGVSHWASVIEIEEGAELSLDSEGLSQGYSRSERPRP